MDSFQMIYFLPLIMLLLSMSQAHAYTTQTPEISGYNSRTMKLTGVTGGYSGGTYSRTGTVIINGKTVPIPGTLKPSSTMGNIVKNALKLNPYKIAGTLAAGYLIEQGIEWMEETSQWVKPSTAGEPCSSQPTSNCYPYQSSGYWFVRNSDGSPHPHLLLSPAPTCTGGTGTIISKSTLTHTNACGTATRPNAGTENWQSTCYASCSTPYPLNAAPVPMTDEDWNALADPMPTVAPELPNAPYLPDGVTIVEPPAYIPETKTIGAPYTKADGSTAQPMAKITPVGDGQVAIDTYEQPLTNPDGTPVPAGSAPVDTTEQPAPPKDPCTDNPKRLGCMEAGEDEQDIPKKEIDFTFTPEENPLSLGSCPAPISVLGHTISYQPACDAMGMISALIIAMSSLTAAYILIGAFKSE